MLMFIFPATLWENDGGSTRNHSWAESSSHSSSRSNHFVHFYSSFSLQLLLHIMKRDSNVIPALFVATEINNMTRQRALMFSVSSFTLSSLFHYLIIACNGDCNSHGKYFSSTSRTLLCHWFDLIYFNCCWNVLSQLVHISSPFPLILHSWLHLHYGNSIHRAWSCLIDYIFHLGTCNWNVMRALWWSFN